MSRNVSYFARNSWIKKWNGEKSNRLMQHLHGRTEQTAKCATKPKLEVVAKPSLFAKEYKTLDYPKSFEVRNLAMLEVVVSFQSKFWFNSKFRCLVVYQIKDLNCKKSSNEQFVKCICPICLKKCHWFITRIMLRDVRHDRLRFVLFPHKTVKNKSFIWKIYF